ncbi:hypothetical protein [Phaffia rhodozyma]|uniref:Uncharacterized protein n=1 Tax=Phaffia rhodozyma TaxID=264483 RepID=A0A0F7SUQ8_PHARH|nr:hypothetical protein [Phaffia rhodozyma]
MPRQPTSYSRPFVPASCGFVARPVDDGPSPMDIDVVETPAAKQNTYGRAPTFHPVSRTAAGNNQPSQMAELTIYLDTDEMDEDSEKVRTQ